MERSVKGGSLMMAGLVQVTTVGGRSIKEYYLIILQHLQF